MHSSTPAVDTGLVSKERLPLLGKRILFTTPRNYAGALGKLLMDRGARPVWMPTIEIWPMPDYGKMDEAISRLAGYDWVTFASENGLRAFGQRLKALQVDGAAMRRTKFVTYAPDAAVLEGYGLKVEMTPDQQSPESIVSGLAKRGVAGGRLLAVVPEVIGIEEPYGVRLYLDHLRRLGLAVERVSGYQTVAVAPESISVEVRMLLAGEVDVIVFTYSGEILAVKRALGDRWLELNRTTLAYKGPFTAKNGKEAGLDTDIVPDTYTMPGLLEALERHFSAGPGQVP